MFSAEEVMVNCIGRTRHDSQWRYATPLATPMTSSILSYSLILMYSLKDLPQKGHLAERRMLQFHAYHLSSLMWSLQEICQRQYWHLTTVRGYRVSISSTLLDTWGAARGKKNYYLISKGTKFSICTFSKSCCSYASSSALKVRCNALIATTCWKVWVVSDFHALL